MDVLMLLTQDIESPSGLGRYYPIAKNLVNQGQFVKIAALHPDFKNLPEKRFASEGVDIHYVAQMHVMKKSGIKTYHSPTKLMWFSLIATIRLSHAALTSGADVIIIGKPHPMNSIAGVLAKIFLRKRLILDIDDDETGSGYFQKKFERNTIQFFEQFVPSFADRISTNTYYSLERLKDQGIPGEKLYYLPNGVEPSRFIASTSVKIDELKAQLNLQGKKIISYIGSMSTTNHAVDELIKAFPFIHNQEPDARLLLVGGGEDIEKLISITLDAEVENLTQFVGRVPPGEVVYYYGISSVTVDPVRDDRAARGRSPLKLFESWLCEVPFVTGNVGDRSRVISDMKDGILVEPGDPKALALGILRILEDQDLRDKLATNGRESVQSYTWNNLTEGFSKILFADH